MISPTSYMNPFVDLTHRSKNTEHAKKNRHGPANWTQKIDMNQIEVALIIKRKEKLLGLGNLNLNQIDITIPITQS